MDERKREEWGRVDFLCMLIPAGRGQATRGWGVRSLFLLFSKNQSRIGSCGEIVGYCRKEKSKIQDLPPVLRLVNSKPGTRNLDLSGSVTLGVFQEIEFWVGILGKNKSSYKFTQKQRNSMRQYLGEILGDVGVLARERNFGRKLETGCFLLSSDFRHGTQAFHDKK